ncbi:unnamed protein product [Urochloa humidicola]
MIYSVAALATGYQQGEISRSGQSRCFRPAEVAVIYFRHRYSLAISCKAPAMEARATRKKVAMQMYVQQEQKQKPSPMQV